MNNYYLLSWRHTSELASAIVLKETRLDYELIAELEGKNFLPFDFELKRIKETKGGLIIDDDLKALKEVWMDYQPNSLAWPLMSKRLRSLIEANLTGNEQIDWITCIVKNRNEERHYFILRFNKMLDVLDMQKTIFVQGTDVIVKPVFSLSKVNNYNIFMAATTGYGCLWKITPGLYVSETLKKAVQKQKLTGLDFEKISVL